MPPSATEGEAGQHPSRALALAALIVAVIWLAVLAAMAIWASNPVTLNRRQLLESQRRGVVVQARVVDVNSGRCEAVRQWPAPRIPGSFQVTNLDHTEARTGESYLLPLLPADGSYVVTPGPGGQLLIYPDSAEALRQLDDLLHE